MGSEAVWIAANSSNFRVDVFPNAALSRDCFLADCVLVLKLLMVVVVGSLQLRRSIAAECIFPDKRFRDFQLAVGSAVCSVAQPDRAAAAAAARASSLNSCKGFAMVWGVG